MNEPIKFVKEQEEFIGVAIAVTLDEEGEDYFIVRYRPEGQKGPVKYTWVSIDNAVYIEPDTQDLK